MSDPDPSPAADSAAPLTGIDLPPGLSPRELADRLAVMPTEVATLPRRDIQTSGDSATVIYLVDEATGRPQFGIVVALVVPARDDADAVVAELQRERWGDPEEQTVTASGPGDAETPAFREFWRAFPPGLFALPNQPIYFLIAYRAGSEQAYMVIATDPATRTELATALDETLRP